MSSLLTRWSCGRPVHSKPKCAVTFCMRRGSSDMKGQVLATFKRH